MWLGPDMFIIVNDPIDVEAILNSPHCLDKDKVYTLVKDGMGTHGLITNAGTFSSKI